MLCKCRMCARIIVCATLGHVLVVAEVEVEVGRFMHCFAEPDVSAKRAAQTLNVRAAVLARNTSQARIKEAIHAEFGYQASDEFI